MQQKKFTLEELASLTGAKLVGDPDYLITNVDSLELATSRDASFLANPHYEQAMLRSKAGVVFVAAVPPSAKERNFLVHQDPSYAFQIIAEAFHGNEEEASGFAGIHPSAVIHPSATLGERCTVGPCAVIDKHVCIGNDTIIGAGCSIGPSVFIGSHCLLHPRVTVRERCRIGNRVILQPGAVIGSCGFGYLTNKEGRHSKLKQLGIVIIEDDVEIGANTTIDRSRFKTTEIRRGTKIDNLVQIGHGVIVGEDNIIVSQTGIAGSTKTGSRVTIAGQVAIAGHLEIASGVVIAGRSGVTKSLMKPGQYGGLPAQPISESNRNAVYVRNLERFARKLNELEKQLKTLLSS